MLPLTPPPAVIVQAIRLAPAAPVASRPPQDRKLVLRRPRTFRSFADCFAQSFHDVSMPELSFENADLNHARFENVNLSGSKIHNANLSDLEIGGAQLGGALIHDIGLPPKGTPAYVEGAEQRPLRFENCDLHGSSIKGSDLRGVSISGCKMQGMKIDGIPVEELLAAYREKHGAPAPPK
jgi:uncharacterized protein YjbI with pentapeptide repeats